MSENPKGRMEISENAREFDADMLCRIIAPGKSLSDFVREWPEIKAEHEKQRHVSEEDTP